MTKYHAIKTSVDGITFASKREARRYQDLKLLQAAKVIRDLELQPTYPITINGIHICNVKLDFQYYDIEKKHVITEDSKGMDNPLSKLKRRMVEAAHGIKVTLV